MLRKFFMLMVTVVLLASVLAGCTGQGNLEQEKEQEKLAVVNGEEILMSEFEEVLESAKAAYAQQGMDLEGEEGKEILNQLEQQVIDSLIDEKLLVQEAQKKGYEVSEQQVTDSIDQIKGQFSDEEQFNQALEENGLTLDALEKAVTKEMLTKQYIENEIGEISVSEEELEEYYAQLKQQQEEVPDLDEIKPQLEQQIAQQKQQQELSKVIEEIKDNSEIEVLI